MVFCFVLVVLKFLLISIFGRLLLLPFLIAFFGVGLKRITYSA